MYLTTNHQAIWTLVLYLSFSMLTGCTTFHFEIVDPTEPVKIATPLVNTVSLHVTSKVGTGTKVSSFPKEVSPTFGPDLLNAVEQRLLRSGATANVENTTKCTPRQYERTICITSTYFTYEKPFYKWVTEVAVVLVLTLTLVGPLLWTLDYQDRVLAEAIVFDKAGKEVARFNTHSEFIASLGTARRVPDTLVSMYSETNKELANRIVIELKRHPHWFEPAPNQSP